MTSTDLKILAVAVGASAVVFGIPVALQLLEGRLLVEHRQPGARVENLRLVDADGEWSGTRQLLPGESATLDVPYTRTGEPQRLRFDLVVDGNRVVLTSKAEVQVAARETKRVAIDGNYAVTHPLATVPPVASTQASP